ncbi:hypothetical protein DdX_09690 [Ditylenchus destructor]|uniref:DUF4817 domain-containing protein n=1 Tax=Ditylenchus destructor TaxID=166010 RepID=A0AAD4N5D9_9BILA|nr:hypothetical protein DdX_09690 [Ditylenchus destructor]
MFEYTIILIGHSPSSFSTKSTCIYTIMVWTLEQKAWCILEFHTHRSPVVVQRNFRRHFNVALRKSLPDAKSITGWYEKFNSGQFERKKRTNTKWEMIDRAIDDYQRRLERCVNVDGRSVEQTYKDA